MEGCSAKDDDDDDDTQQQKKCILRCAELYSITPAPFPNQRADILQMHWYNNSNDMFQVRPEHGTDPIKSFSAYIRVKSSLHLEDDPLGAFRFRYLHFSSSAPVH
jgi:hypothetical protein